MDSRRSRTHLILGSLLVLAGVWIVLDQNAPDFHDLFARYIQWPNNLVLIGAGLLVFGLVFGAPGMAVPAAIVAGIGGIFIYQQDQLNGDYGSWSYMWALIPGFVGVGSILAGLMGERTRRNLRRGLNLIVLSTVLFLLFSSLLGGWELLGTFGPAILMILLGLWVIGSSIVQSIRERRSPPEPKKEGE